MSLADKFNDLENDLPVTRALAEWDGQFTVTAWERLQEVMNRDFFTADRRDGAGRIRPSSIGQACPRPALLSYHGYPADPEPRAARSIMDAGTWRHYYWQLVGLSAGFLDDIEVPIDHAPWRLKGSADGIGSEVGVFEFKSTNSTKMSQIRGTSAAQHRPDEAHLRQVQAYMRATGLETASLVYEDRAYLSFLEVRVSADDAAQDDLGRLFSAWNAHIANDTLPAILPACWEQSGAQFRSCSWKESCFRAG